MEYRKFGKLDWKVSALGFGVMRLPIIGNDPANINEPEATRMVRYAIDNGVNYLDTGYMYHAGSSERFLGRALKDGYRRKIKLTTKLPSMFVHATSDFDKIFNEQLERLQTDNVDFYLLHGIDNRSWPKLRDFGVLKWAERKIAGGQIKHLGFSFHDDYPMFKNIIDAYDDWAICQIQYNYIDSENQPGRRGLEYAAGKGLAVTIMEPLRGGQLSRKPPEAVAKIWGDNVQRRSLTEWALQWLWNQPEVSMVLSGMSTMEQVVENLASASRSKVGLLMGDELSLLEQVRHAYQNLNAVPCTGCRYCQPCPNGVKIPEIFQIYNDAMVYGDLRHFQIPYNGGPGGLVQGQRADSCTECETCMEICPQKISIVETLGKAHKLLRTQDLPF